MSFELKGIPAAGGLARGRALQFRDEGLIVPEFTPEDLAAEKGRLASARAEAERQLHGLSEQLSGQVGEAEAALFEAQAMFLNDSVLVNKAEAEIETGVNAERAWHRSCEFFAIQLESLPDETLRARSADVRDVGRRVVEILMGIQSGLLITDPAIVLARDLAPSQTASLDASKVLAFCTAEGGPTSHTAILAKALGIPAVVGVGIDLLDIPDGSMILVNGTDGLVVSDPDPDLLAAFDEKIQAEAKERQRKIESALQPAVTVDGHRIEVVANVGNVEDARKALANGAEGIGLLRTEFLFLNRSQIPDEQTQFSAYRTFFELMENRPVVVRTLDIGGDKDVPYYDFGEEANPFMGYRAIRISLDHPEDLKSQLRALLRAGAGHDLRIMFPMVAALAEIRNAKKLLKEARGELVSRNIEIAEAVQVGMMVEIPAAVLLADQFAGEVDFFSIGTNDLTQYTFAAERGNRRVAHLNDACHPAILRQINRVVQVAHENGKWVGVCGEMAGDGQAVPVLLGLGVDELSMSPALIPVVKNVIRGWSVEKAKQLATQTLDFDGASTVREAVLRTKTTR